MILRKTIALLLVFNTLLGVLWQPLVYVDFKLRQDYIAKVLCIKKDEPITVCGGSCVLAKRLKKVDPPAEQNRSQQRESKLLEIHFFHSKTNIEVPTGYEKTVNTFSLKEYNLAPCKGYTLDVFNPPKPSC